MAKTTAKSTVRTAEPPAALAEVPTILKDAYLLQESTLFPLAGEYPLSGATTERKFKSAAELEDIVFENAKIIFGQDTIMIGNERKTGRGAKDQVSPASFLLDVRDVRNPRLYIVDVFLLKDDFYSMTFPRVTKLLSYLNNEGYGTAIVELLKKNKEVLRLYKEGYEEYFFRAFYAQPSVILVMDREMTEYTDMQKVYTEWRLVQPMVCMKYSSNGNIFCTIMPAFKPLLLNGKSKDTKEKKEVKAGPYTEEDHIAKASPVVREVYTTIKAELLQANSGLIFNPQKYYISVKNGKNIAMFRFSSKGIRLVVMKSEADTRKLVKHYVIKTLTKKVQQFWNGPSCEIAIQNKEHLDEVVELLKGLVTA